jgi:hypothetical protein
MKSFITILVAFMYLYGPDAVQAAPLDTVAKGILVRILLHVPNND